ncbi:MAG: DUF192 domain-containing protein [DPANN group archaeon]|nr:DUF192 domain-containing protein [DPANN group archaeon]
MIAVKYKNKTIEAELADNWWKISKGLSFSFRKRNMFFEMPREDHWPFGMFGMFFPIKIIFMDKNKNIINEFNAKPFGFDIKTWRTYKPAGPAKYVLEIPI